MATVKTLEGQSIWDLVTRYYASPDELSKIVLQFDNINVDVPTFTEIEIEESNSNIVALFDTNKTQVATLEQEEPSLIEGGFEYGFDLEIN